MRVVFKTDYNQDIKLAKHSGYVFWYACLIVAMIAAPFALNSNALDAGWVVDELSLIMIYAVAGLGLMVLTGYTGMVSLGHAAFLAIGAYTNGFLMEQGVSFLVSFFVAGALSGIVGLLLAIPTMRMTGIYLSIATIAFAVIVESIIIHWSSVTGGNRGMPINAPDLFGYELWDPLEFYFLCLVVLVLIVVLVANLMRSSTGRALVALRDSEVSAQSMGINIPYYKAVAFGLSAMITGFAGALYAHKITFLSVESFNFIESVRLLLMVVVGGLGSIHGAIFGAIFIGLLPVFLSLVRDFLPTGIANAPGLEPGLFGIILMLFILFEPMGIYGRWLKIKLYFAIFPLYRKATFKRQKTYLKTERLH